MILPAPPRGAGDVLIVGGNGFLGQHTAASLTDAGATVHILDRPGSVPSEAVGRYRQYEGSVTEARHVEEAVAESRPDTIIVLASYAHHGLGLLRSAEQNPAGAIEVNVAGLMNVLDVAVRRTGTQFVWLSSTTVYGEAARYGATAVSEDSLLSPRSTYAATKVLGEQLLRTYRSTHGLNATAVRPTLVWGPGLRYVGVQSCLGDMVAAAADGRELTVGDGTELWDLLYVRDAGRAVAWLAGRDIGPVVIVNGYQASVRQVREAVLAAVPDANIHVDGAMPDLDVPPVDDRLMRASGFRPEFDLAGSVEDYLTSVRDDNA